MRKGPELFSAAALFLVFPRGHKGHGMQGRAPGHKKFRVLGKKRVAFGQGEGVYKTLTQGGQKGQRAAEEGDFALDLPAADLR